MFDSSGSPRVIVVKAMLKMSWQRFTHSLGWQPKLNSGMRAPTRGKFKMGALLSILFMLVMLFQSFFQTRAMIVTHAEPILDTASGKISVDRFLYNQMDGYDDRFGSSKKFIEDQIRREVERGDIRLPADEVIEIFEKNGVAAFRVNDQSLFDHFNLHKVKSSERAPFDRVIGMVFVAIFIALFCMPFAVREKDLASTNGYLEWLYSLPLRGSEILLGKFISTSLIRPLLLIALWPFLTNLLIIAGHSWPIAAFFALSLGLLISVSMAGIELLLDTWLRSRATAVTVQNLQMAMMIIGQLGFYMALASCMASKPTLPWVTWLADRLPGQICQPIGTLLMAPTVFFPTMVIVSATLGLGGYALSAQMLRAGLLSGSGSRTKARTLSHGKMISRSRLACEWLLIKRDRTLATQVIAFPLLMVAYQLLINPKLLANASAAGIAAGIYACGALASLTTASSLLYSEIKGAWLIYNLPIPISSYFQNREKLWRGISTILAGLLLLTAIFLAQSFSLGELWLYAAALLGVWVMGRMVSGIVLGQPKLPNAYNGERPKINLGRTYGAMLLAGSYGGLLYWGDLWAMISALVLFGFLGTAIWQRRQISFRHLMEPTEKEPPSWGVDDALWSVFVFLMVQTIALQILIANGVVAGQAVLIAFLIGGGIASAFTRLRCRSKGLPLPPLQGFSEAAISQKRIVAETCVASVICIAVGAAWIGGIRAGWFMDPTLWQEAQETMSQPFFVFMAVVAAPLIEEPLFRGFVLRTMTGFWRIVPSIFASALLFAIIHPGTSFPPVFLVGIVTAVLYLRSRSLMAPIMLHAVYNFSVVVLAKWL